MTIEFNYISLIDLLAAVQGSLLGLLLISRFKTHISFLFLGLFVFGYSVELFTSVIDETNLLAEHPKLYFLPLRFYFLFMPALFLYAKSLTQKLNWKKEYWHLVPGAAEFLLGLGLFIFIESTLANPHFEGESFQIYDIFYHIIAWFWITGYAIALLLFVRKHRKNVENFHSDTQGKLLGWVKAIAIYVISINIFMLLSMIILPENINDFITPIMNSLNVLFIFWVALSGFRQTAIEMPDFDKKSLPQKIDTTPTSVENDESEQLFEKLKLKIETEKYYTNHHLHLNGLAEHLNLSPRRLSELINEKAGVNFNQFINQFRVEEAKRLLVDPRFSHFNMLGIADEVGFNSKATFYSMFKQFAGMTPNKFQKAQLLM